MTTCYKQANIELKKLFTEKGNDEGSFEAYLAVYNNIDFGDDIIDPQAFNNEPAEKKYPLLADHDTKTVIGHFTALSDGYGLKINGKINLSTKDGTDIILVPKAAEKYANLKNGDISGFSVGYIPKEIDWKEIDGKKIRIIKKAQLMEGSVVTFPMNEKARLLSIKSIEETTSLKEVERILKDNGFSIKDSKTVISKIKEFSPRDEEEEKSETLECDALAESVLNFKKALQEIELKQRLSALNNILSTNKS